MGSTFNPQILVEKLTKLNNSQQSIETLSHWCIFHMNKSKLVVDTWDRQFHCSPREQRLAFLYLANDILQNSRRKGLEFVAEFWKVLPDALRDVISNGDEFGRNAARRLIGIWEERKVFGSKGQILKEEFLGRQLENSSRNEKQSGFKLRQSAGNSVDKIVSCYQVLYGELDEDAILNKYHNAISSLEKVDKEIVGDISSGQCIGILEELQGQHAILRDCTEELKTVESSRASLVSHLREALQEQEFKLDQTRHQLQASQSRSDHVADLCQQLLKVADIQLYSEDCTKEVHARTASHGLLPPEGERSASSHVEEDPRKATAAAVAAKLTASTSSAQMLSFVLSSLASEGVIGDSTAESSGDYPSDKRPKIDNDQPYVPSQNPQPPMPSYPHPESLHHTSKNEPPPPPSSSPPPLPPLPPVPPYPASQFMQSAGIMTGVPYSYGMTLPPPPPPSLPGYPTVTGMSPFAAPPTNHYQSFQGSQGGFYGQASSLPMAPQ